MTTEELEALREQISSVDEEMLALIGRRMEIAREIGRTKRKDNVGIRDSSREELVVRSAAERAADVGIDQTTAAAITEVLIDAAVKVQNEDPEQPLSGMKALVVGAGRMGAWTARFLSNRGAAVSVYDPRAELKGYANLSSSDETARDADFVIIASPLGTAVADTQMIMSSEPTGVVFDLCSVKTHMKDVLRDGAQRGVKVTSVHPMFGAGVPTPAGRNVLVCSCGCDEADMAARSLFESAGANVRAVSIEGHDDLIALVLGAPHLCALLFGEVISNSSQHLETLAEVGGPSFSRMAALASGISNESRRVYHDIQRLNPQSSSILDSMAVALESLRGASLEVDPAAFAKIMDDQKEYFGGGKK